ncbi:PREDICTED: uncharacterized protein LOC105960782 [Erythranthe guttata]|uniref:uncharacterized protein LOC105960782 n=1 Tax=Erythranthe guttata TaxID=4155 RepID=UPI00064D7C82|nr:PREDICTED: uncharacterized protein LOC105960782 [Erythranthe guttata]|eukprot:XP_012840446.1 PREDICTED: uncharacterized protein LOC105960782 [Erythranthe guttata]
MAEEVKVEVEVEVDVKVEVEAEEEVHDYDKERKHHKHLQQLTGLGAMAAGAYALHEKHKAKKDPENAHKHKVKEHIAAVVAVGVGGIAFHEGHEKKDAKKKSKDIKNGKHNHNPHKYPQGLRSLSRLTEEQREVTKILKKSHVKPKEILHHLRQMNPDTAASLREVYNESQKIRREEMKGKTVIQHLWHELSESGYSKWHRTNPAGDTVQDVMFAHPDSIKLLQLFPYVILMDCTYKTNR